MKKIQFQNKEESNRKKKADFLALSPSGRFLHFLKLCDALAPFSKPKTDFGNNLVLERKKVKSRKRGKIPFFLPSDRR